MSMTFGRPASIPEPYIKVDLPKEYPPSSLPGTNTFTSFEARNPANVSFFAATVYLDPRFVSECSYG